MTPVVQVTDVPDPNKQKDPRVRPKHKKQAEISIVRVWTCSIRILSKLWPVVAFDLKTVQNDKTKLIPTEISGPKRSIGFEAGPKNRNPDESCDVISLDSSESSWRASS